MEEAMAVNVVESTGELINDVSDLLVREGIIVKLSHLHHSIQIHVKQLKHHIQSVFMPNDLNTGYNIWVLQTNHSFHLGVSHSGFPRCKLSLESLQGVYLLGFLVCNLINDSKATFAECFEDSKSFYKQCASGMGLYLI